MTAGADRPAHRQPRLVGLVALGGVVGTLARAGVRELVGDPGWPGATLLVNLTGAFALALLTGWLVGLGPDAGRRRATRLLLGTGVLGAYTTYSALAVESERLLAGGRVAAGLGYAVGTVVAGLALSVAGLAVADGWHRRRGGAGGSA